ncbi:MAG: alanine racemase [Acidobacteriia bacterium]|nr:alanine racemase [Terriglobia bacterium]
MSRAPHRCWIEVSRRQIACNFRAVRELVGTGVELAPVVKADAYRHGAVEVSRILAAEGTRWLAVSNVEEGVALRQAGATARILIMADVLPFELDALLACQLTPVIHSLGHLRELDEASGRPLSNPRKTELAARPFALHYHLKIDSGLGRLGTQSSAATIASAVEGCRHAKLEGLMTHFASAADYTKSQTDEQIRYFNMISDGLRERGIDPPYRHLSGTIPIAYGRRDAWRNMVRPGHAIYGYVSPTRGEHAPPSQLTVAPALQWRTAILDIKHVERGARIGYGGTFQAKQPMRIGVLAAGYADGIPHSLSNKGHVIAAEKLVPIVGAISMDLTTIDLTSVPQLGPGDAVTLLGREGEASQDAQQMARAAGSISYSLLCGISARVHRVYLD